MSSKAETNPLLTNGFLVPFDRIRAAEVEPAIAQLLAESRRRLDQIAQDPGQRDFANTMIPLDEFTEPLDYAMAVVRHLEAVATYPELRSALNAVQPEVSAFYSGIPLHDGLWKAVKAYAGTPEAKGLSGEKKRFTEKTVENFRRHGADLDPAGK